MALAAVAAVAGSGAGVSAAALGAMARDALPGGPAGVSAPGGLALSALAGPRNTGPLPMKLRLSRKKRHT